MSQNRPHLFSASARPRLVCVETNSSSLHERPLRPAPPEVLPTTSHPLWQGIAFSQGCSRFESHHNLLSNTKPCQEKHLFDKKKAVSFFRRCFLLIRLVILDLSMVLGYADKSKMAGGKLNLQLHVFYSAGSTALGEQPFSASLSHISTAVPDSIPPLDRKRDCAQNTNRRHQHGASVDWIVCMCGALSFSAHPLKK